MTNENFAITNKTKNTLPRLSFVDIKNSVLGKKYNLSLVFIGEKKSSELNCSYRNKKGPTNILSFPLNKDGGEIFITLSLAKKEAKRFGEKFHNFIGLLFIHGLLHLKGMGHGSRMERAEAKLYKQFCV